MTSAETPVLIAIKPAETSTIKTTETSTIKTTDIPTIKIYKEYLLEIKYITNVITDDECIQLIMSLDKCSWNIKTRSAKFFGDDDINYKTTFKGTEKTRNMNNWSELPALTSIKTRIEQLTGLKFTCVAIQYYHDGNVGIGAHRDKEIGIDEYIVGLSVGATRTFRFKRWENIVDVALENKSLYIVDGITNTYWSHEIIKDDTIEDCRYSLTFRTYINK
jgi:alkylated DNA repair dioxygenase AlkB